MSNNNGESTMSNNENAEWEKIVDKAAEKFRAQAYKAVENFHGSTFSTEAAELLSDAFATIVKSKDIGVVKEQIFTQSFLKGVPK